ncbi:MAG: Crp/Fnr family transcriptional regulator [Acidobacteriia bacterium]|nr:Crp/Fnr family transcriptional regulator [Terriglobia bacterium]
MRDAENGGSSARCVDCAAQAKCNFFSSPIVQAVTERGFYGRGYLIVQQGEVAREVFMVRAGWLRLSHVSASGKAVADLVGPGTLLGVPEVVTGTPHKNSVETLEECDLEWVNADAFLSLLTTSPLLSLELLKTVSQQVLKLASRLNDHAGGLPSGRRLLLALREISENCGALTPQGVRIRLPLSMQDLADKVGCSRQWIWKMLGELEAEGYLRRKGSWITLLAASANARSKLGKSA